MRCLFLWGSLKSPAKMEFDSRLDEKPISCGKNQGLQSVTLQYQFYFQKFSDFLRARTQNVHLTVLYYGQSTKIRGVDNGNFRRTERIKSC